MSDVDQIIQRLDQWERDVVEGLADGLFLGAEHILGVSNAHVPIEEATLERSGKTSIDRQQLDAAVSYDTPYAVVQHEDLGMEHDPGRTAKYLENALNGERNTVGRIITTAARRKAGS